jgi:hypothetical protein
MITKHKRAFNEKITDSLRLLYQGTKSREYLSIKQDLNTFCEFVKKKTEVLKENFFTLDFWPKNGLLCLNKVKFGQELLAGFIFWRPRRF